MNGNEGTAFEREEESKVVGSGSVLLYAFRLAGFQRFCGLHHQHNIFSFSDFHHSILLSFLKSQLTSFGDAVDYLHPIRLQRRLPTPPLLAIRELLAGRLTRKLGERSNVATSDPTTFVSGSSTYHYLEISACKYSSQDDISIELTICASHHTWPYLKADLF